MPAETATQRRADGPGRGERSYAACSCTQAAPEAADRLQGRHRGKRGVLRPPGRPGRCVALPSGEGPRGCGAAARLAAGTASEKIAFRLKSGRGRCLWLSQAHPMQGEPVKGGFLVFWCVLLHGCFSRRESRASEPIQKGSVAQVNTHSLGSNGPENSFEKNS